LKCYKSNCFYVKTCTSLYINFGKKKDIEKDIIQIALPKQRPSSAIMFYPRFPSHSLLPGNSPYKKNPGALLEIIRRQEHGKSGKPELPLSSIFPFGHLLPEKVAFLFVGHKLTLSY
jgi:hypothetical protein